MGGNLGIWGKSGRFRPGSRVIMTFEWGVNLNLIDIKSALKIKPSSETYVIII